MANRITINFSAKGHAGVTQAVKALNNQVDKLIAANSLLSGSSKKLTADQAILAGSMMNTTNKTRNQANAFSTLRSQMLLASFAATVVAGSILKITNMAGDAAEQMSKASVVFGVSFNSMTQFAEEFGNTVNRSTFELMEMAASVQDILVPMGIARVSAADLSQEIVKLAVDVGSFSNVASKDVMRDFNSALVGNHETVRKYGIVISEARLKTVALQEGIIDTGEELTDQEKILARLAIIQKDSSDAQGDAAKTANSYANTMEGLKAQFHETAVVVGDVFLPAVKALASVFTVLLKLMQRPTAILLMIVAFGALAKNILFSAKNMKILRRQTSKAIVKMKAFKLSLGAIGVAMIALEVLFSMWDNLFPDEVAQQVEENTKKAQESLKKLADELNDMSLDQVQQGFAQTKKELADLEDQQLRLTQTVSKGHITLSNYNVAMLEGGNFAAKHNKKVDDAKVTLKLLEPILKGVREEYEMYSSALESAGFKSEALFKFQGKYTQTIKDQVHELTRWAIANNNVKLLQQVNTQAFNLFSMSMQKTGNNWNKSQAITIKFIKLQKLAMDAGLGPLSTLDDKTKQLLETFMELGEEVAFEKLKESLNDKIEAVNGVSEAQIIANKYAEEGIVFTKAQINELQDLIDKERELREEKIASAKIPQLTADVDKIESQIDRSGEHPELIIAKKTSKDILNDFKDRTTTIEEFEKGHQDKIERLKKDSLLSTYVDMQENEAKILEWKKELGQEELDFLIDLEQQKQEVRQQTIDMAFETFGQITALMQSNLNQQLNAELEALKKSREYKRADQKQQQKMEDDIKKDFEDDQKTIFRLNKASSLASIYMDTSSAVMAAVEAFPLSGGMPWTAIIKGMGAIQAGVVLSQKPPKMAEGGYIGGRPHSQGGTLIEAERGEFVMSRDAVNSIGIENLNKLNRTGSVGASVQVNVTGNLMTEDFVEGELAEAIKEAVRKGSDFGIS